MEIHRKPGYDPVELFLDPAIRIPPLTVGWKLLKRKAGFRSLLDVIPLDATLVKGSHGRQTGWDEEGPVFISTAKDLVPVDERSRSVDVHDLISEASVQIACEMMACSLRSERRYLTGAEQDTPRRRSMNPRSVFSGGRPSVGIVRRPHRTPRCCRSCACRRSCPAR